MAGSKTRSGVFVLTVVCAVTVASAVEFAIGGKAGWAVGTNYTEWAAGKKFHVGDALVFKYNKQYHDVLQVTKANYNSCTAAKPLSSANTGNDTVLLEAPGPHYFICGFPGHCEGGQKLEISVTSAAAAGGPSPAPLSPGASPASSPSKPPSSSPSKSPVQSPSPKAAGPASPSASHPPHSHANPVVSVGAGIPGIVGTFWIFSFLAII